MCFNNIFIIRDLTRCDNSLRIASGLSVSQGYSSTIANIFCSALTQLNDQGKISLSSPTNEQMYLHETRAQTLLHRGQAAWLSLS